MVNITSDLIAQIFDMYSDMVYRISLNIVKNPEEAQDVVMDVFSALLKNTCFSDMEHIKAWLIRSAEHRSINVIKSARKRRNVPIDEILENTLTAPLSESEFEVLDLVMHLPEKMRTTVYMFYYEDMSAADIASALGISENTVYKRLERGREMLRIDLEGAAI